MTKPNELTPEQAIERVEDHSIFEDIDHHTAEALHIVLELAKRPYALGEGDRNALISLLGSQAYGHKALCAALSLAEKP